MGMVSFPAILEDLDNMIGFIIDSSRDQGLDDSKLSKIKLASEEILVNIINYAYPDSKGDISINCEPLQGERKGISIEIRDSGVEFNILEKTDPDTTLPMEDRPIGGLGVFLVKQAMDEVEYLREKSQNVVKMVKYS